MKQTYLSQTSETFHWFKILPLPFTVSHSLVASTARVLMRGQRAREFSWFDLYCFSFIVNYHNFKHVRSFLLFIRFRHYSYAIIWRRCYSRQKHWMDWSRKTSAKLQCMPNPLGTGNSGERSRKDQVFTVYGKKTCRSFLWEI